MQSKDTANDRKQYPYLLQAGPRRETLLKVRIRQRLLHLPKVPHADTIKGVSDNIDDVIQKPNILGEECIQKPHNKKSTKAVEKHAQ